MPLFSVTEMFTTAGNTRLTSGAKLCCGNTAAGGGEAGAGSTAAGGFSAHTSGDNASVAPRPNPTAAARVLLTHGRREGNTENSVILHLPVVRMIATTWEGKLTARFQVD